MDISRRRNREKSGATTSETACIRGCVERRTTSLPSEGTSSEDVARTGGTKGLQVFAGHIRNLRRRATFFFSTNPFCSWFDEREEIGVQRLNF